MSSCGMLTFGFRGSGLGVSYVHCGVGIYKSVEKTASFPAHGMVASRDPASPYQPFIWPLRGVWG